MESAFRQEQLKLVSCSTNMKYFVFEGPVFVDREKKNKKDKDNKKGEERKTAGGVGGLLNKAATEEGTDGLLGGLMAARKDAEEK